MKHLFLRLIAATLLVCSCKSKSSNIGTEVSPLTTEATAGLLNYKDAAKPFNRMFPDKLRDLPNEITAAHYPNPCYATLEDNMYIWKHNTTIQTKEDLQIVEYGSFVYTEKGWYLRTSMSAKDFEKYYNCNDGLLKKGVVYTDNASWRRGKALSGGDAMWFYIAKDKNGRLVKGTASIETEGKLINSYSSSAKILSSNISWTGYGEIGGYSLTGKINMKEANIQTQGDSLLSATIAINMATISHEDKNLEHHLKDKDFFDVTKYPSAIFKTSKIEYLNEISANATGNLTIKGITHLVTIPLLITKNAESKILKAIVSIDRTKYGIKYNSKNFFGNLGDKAIKNNFDFAFTIDIN